MQGAAAIRVDADPVAMESIGAGAVALVDGDIDPGALETVGQTEPAGASADDQDA
jgi:hypothetical protein